MPFFKKKFRRSYLGFGLKKDDSDGSKRRVRRKEVVKDEEGVGLGSTLGMGDGERYEVFNLEADPSHTAQGW